MMKELFMAAHERLIEEYLEANPNATEHEACRKTADHAHARMIDNLGDMIDRARQRQKDSRI